MAVPVFESIIQAVWAYVVPKETLAPPSTEARRQLSCKSADVESEGRRRRSEEGISECFRLDEQGRVHDTRYSLVSRRRDSEDRDEPVIRKRIEPVETSEPAGLFEGQRRAPWRTRPWQSAPNQTPPQWGSTLDNGRGRPALRDSQGRPEPGNSIFDWLRN